MKMHLASAVQEFPLIARLSGLGKALPILGKPWGRLARNSMQSSSLRSGNLANWPRRLPFGHSNDNPEFLY